MQTRPNNKRRRRRGDGSTVDEGKRKGLQSSLGATALPPALKPSQTKSEKTTTIGRTTISTFNASWIGLLNLYGCRKLIGTILKFLHHFDKSVPASNGKRGGTVGRYSRGRTAKLLKVSYLVHCKTIEIMSERHLRVLLWFLPVVLAGGRTPDVLVLMCELPRGWHPFARGNTSWIDVPSLRLYNGAGHST